MSTKREPLLSDGEIRMISDDEAEDAGICDGPEFAAIVLASTYVRDYYEGLITTGKLRVVEEVEEVWVGSGHYRGCSRCGAGFTQRANYCPGCGNPIKR